MSARSQQVAARTVVGVAGLPVFMGGSDPELQRLPFDGASFSRDIWLVVHADLRHSPAIRAVIGVISDAATRTFAQNSAV